LDISSFQNRCSRVSFCFHKKRFPSSFQLLPNIVLKSQLPTILNTFVCFAGAVCLLSNHFVPMSAVYLCGDPGAGGPATNHLVLSPIPALRDQRVKMVAQTKFGGYTLILTTDGKVKEWKEESNGGFTVTSGSLITESVVDIACGAEHSAAVTSCGKVYTWGRASEVGALGHGLDYTLRGQMPGGPVDYATPKQVETKGLAGLKFKQVECGNGFTLALTRNGQVYGWGNNTCGQLGRGSAGNDHTTLFPAKVTHLSKVKQIATGYNYCAAIAGNNNQIFTWGGGENEEEPCAIGAMLAQDLPYAVTPQPVEDLDNAVFVSCGFYHTGVLRQDGSLYMFGANGSGELLGLKNDYQPRHVPALVSSLEGNVDEVSCGKEHTVVKMEDGSIWTWYVSAFPYPHFTPHFFGSI
jgi:hypothetical protein